ncbi:ABC transporter ATP-binding protein [Dietzia aerolata]|uniref:ABC transporter ATP-binding protein n=1 Tax=Dietzia aerolata TaxID=595984 RepID=UPI00362CEF01
MTFGYGKNNRDDDDNTAVLHSVDFEAPAGTTTAVVGPSGSGKTTLLRLAARFYVPGQGGISIGGVDLAELGTDAALKQVSLVFQDVYLFDQSVMENIRVGRPGATDDEVFAAARVARVDEIVERLPDGWDTRVGEGGAALSGGERQRVSVARALLKDAPIVLLDEATSALDPQNEAAVVAGIRELTRDKTVVVVAHRLPTIRHADQILFLDAGQVVERGSHDELIALGGRYADFWDKRSTASGWRLEATTF